MSTSSKVKVSTEKLLDAVKARRAAMVAEYERSVSRYEKDQTAYQGKVCDALARALAAAEGGRLPDCGSSYKGQRLEVPVRFATPIKPRKDTGQIDRLIATLEMAADETMVISADDATRYLG